MAETPPVAYKKGQGPDQLPQGGATQVNEQVQAEKPDKSQPRPVTSPEQQPEDQQASGNFETPVDFQPKSDEEKFLFAPPQEDQTTTHGAPMGSGEPIPPPPGVEDWLPHLQMAANDPNASPQVKALFSLVSYHMNNS